MDASAWVDLVGIIVNTILAVWIVTTIQNKVNNKRILKDHFIDELKEIRSAYNQFFEEIYKGQLDSKNSLIRLKLISKKVNDLMFQINWKYRKINMGFFAPYQVDLNILLTNDPNFVRQYAAGGIVTFSEASITQFLIFQQTHDHLFNEMIAAVNDAD